MPVSNNYFMARKRLVIYTCISTKLIENNDLFLGNL